MALIEEIEVFYEKLVVGRIYIHDQQRIGFSYDPRWLENEPNFPLSVTMPLGAGEFDEDIIITWLANLLPEGQQLTTLARVLGHSASDVIGILQEIGGDIAGAISIGDPSDRKVWCYETLLHHYGTDTEQEALDLHFDDLGRKPLLVGVDGVRLSLAGGQKKTALAVLDDGGQPKLGLPEPTDILAIPKTGAPSTIIIKPDNPELIGIVENEAYCLTLAKMIGIQAVDCKIIKTANRSALAVARYDRYLSKDGSIRRIHQEDFTQANNFYPIQKYEQGIVRGLDLNMLLLTGNHLPPLEALKLLDQVIFNILVANTDAHAKNYSMILSDRPTMAPLYDVSSVLLWDHINQYHAQKIAGRKLRPFNTSRKHWDLIAEQAGLNTYNFRLRVQNLVDKMAKNRKAASDLVASNAGSSSKIISHIAKIIEWNALRIASRLT